MHKHEHDCCEHCLHYCSCCDKTYCCKCGREWGGVVYSSPYWYQPAYPYYWPYTITIYTGDIPSGTINCTHNH